MAVQTPFALADVAIGYADRMLLFNAIAEQIWREQQLVSTRMGWNFTFQAFLAGIYVFAASNLDDMARFPVQLVIGLVGLAVTTLSLLGVRAAQRQSTRLKKHWLAEFHPDPEQRPADCNIQAGAFPQPFSPSTGSIPGRSSSIGVCISLFLMWTAMLSIAVWMHGRTSGTAGAYTCQLRPAPSTRGGLDIACAPALEPPKPKPTPPASVAPPPPAQLTPPEGRTGAPRGRDH